MGRRKEARQGGSCSQVIKIIRIIWLFFLPSPCRRWYAIGEYNEIWSRSCMIMKNTCGSHAFVHLLHCRMIMVYGMHRFTETALCTGPVVCKNDRETLQSYCTYLSLMHKSNCRSAKLSAFLMCNWRIFPHVCVIICVYWEKGVCLSLELIKCRAHFTYTNKKKPRC